MGVWDLITFFIALKDSGVAEKSFDPIFSVLMVFVKTVASILISG